MNLECFSSLKKVFGLNIVVSLTFFFQFFFCPHPSPSTQPISFPQNDWRYNIAKSCGKIKGWDEGWREEKRWEEGGYRGGLKKYIQHTFPRPHF